MTRNPPLKLETHERTEVPLKVTLVEVRIQVSPEAFTTCDSATDPVRPLTAVSVMVELALPPTVGIV